VIHPTPSPYPPGTPIFTIPPEYSLWASTDPAIQAWHTIGGGQLIIQAIFLLLIVYLGMRVVLNFIREFTQQDAEE
jgi:hypothetical protein